MIVYVNNTPIQYINRERALRVAKQHDTVVFGLPPAEPKFQLRFVFIRIIRR